MQGMRAQRRPPQMSIESPSPSQSRGPARRSPRVRQGALCVWTAKSLADLARQVSEFVRAPDPSHRSHPSPQRGRRSEAPPLTNAGRNLGPRQYGGRDVQGCDDRQFLAQGGLVVNLSNQRPPSRVGCVPANMQWHQRARNHASTTATSRGPGKVHRRNLGEQRSGRVRNRSVARHADYDAAHTAAGNLVEVHDSVVLSELSWVRSRQRSATTSQMTRLCQRYSCCYTTRSQVSLCR